MTTEADFQSALDANPEDHHTRLVFADWLQDRDDPRAEGYRALGVLRKRPAPSAKESSVPRTVEDLTDPTFNYCRPGTTYGALTAADMWQFTLPDDWCAAVWRALVKSPCTWTHAWPSRRAAEDDAAAGFALLPADRRAQLLRGPQ